MGGALLTQSGCLGDDAVFDFLHARLSAAARTEIEAHLDVCADCRALVAEAGKYAVGRDASTEDAAPSRVSAPSATLPRFLDPGTHVGRYVVRGVTGAGGMGIVYVAHDPELARDVALKLLRSEVSVIDGLEVARERLLREARAMASLSHPNVVTVYDVGTFHGQVFVAMELVDGRTLRQWLGERPRPWDEVVRVYLEAGKGLAAAHAKGLVHRDFKPSNVLIGSDDRVRVTDFGLARPARSLPEPASPALAATTQPAARASWAALTETGALVGTPAYMAPEQFLGASSDARSDQFSYCVALYEGLTGERPSVDGANLRVPSLALQAILERGLQQAPELRFSSMDGLLAALTETLALPPRPRSRRRPVLLGGVAGLVVAIACAWLVVYRARSPGRDIAPAVASTSVTAPAPEPEPTSAAPNIDPPPTASSTSVAPPPPRAKHARTPVRAAPSARPAKADAERHGNNLLDPFEGQ